MQRVNLGEFEEAFKVAEDARDPTLSKVLLWLSFQKKNRQQNQQTSTNALNRLDHTRRNVDNFIRSSQSSPVGTHSGGTNRNRLNCHVPVPGGNSVC